MDICILNGALLQISNASGSCIHTVWRCFWGNKEFFVRTEKGKEPKITNVNSVPEAVLDRAIKAITNREYMR